MSLPDAERDDDATPDRATVRAPSFARWLLELAATFAVAGIIAWVLLTYVVMQYEIPSASMEDTLQIGDRVLVNKLAYRFGRPAPGDIVVFLSPDGDHTDWVKRVVAVAGQTVDIRDDVVYVDDEPLKEPYVNRRYLRHFDADGAIRVPKGTVFLMGDNRGSSRDSSLVGPQPVTHIIGRAEAIVWPLDRARGL